MTPSTQRTSKGGWVNLRSLARGSNGRALCRWCALEVPRGRRTFCSADCVHEWKLRTDPAYLREQVFARDRGVCAGCATDTEALRMEFRKLDYRSRRQFLKEWKLKEGWRRSLWDADHVIPVAEGGGECDLENMRTLCLKCHRAVTAELRQRLRKSWGGPPGPRPTPPSACRILDPIAGRGRPARTRASAPRVGQA